MVTLRDIVFIAIVFKLSGAFGFYGVYILAWRKDRRRTMSAVLCTMIWIMLLWLGYIMVWLLFTR